MVLKPTVLKSTSSRRDLVTASVRIGGVRSSAFFAIRMLRIVLWCCSASRESGAILQCFHKFVEGHSEKIGDSSRWDESMLLIKARCTLQWERRIQSYELAVRVAKVILNSSQQSYGHAFPLPIWHDGHSAQMSLLTADLATNRADHVSFPNTYKQLHFFHSTLKRAL